MTKDCLTVFWSLDHTTTGNNLSEWTRNKKSKHREKYPNKTSSCRKLLSQCALCWNSGACKTKHTPSTHVVILTVVQQPYSQGGPAQWWGVHLHSSTHQDPPPSPLHNPPSQAESSQQWPKHRSSNDCPARLLVFWVSAMTGWLRVPILWLTEIYFYLGEAACTTVSVDPSLRYTSMLLGCSVIYTLQPDTGCVWPSVMLQYPQAPTAMWGRRVV